MRTVVCDIEADGLLPHVSKIWCIVAKDYEDGTIYTFTSDPDDDHPNVEDFHAFADEVHHWIGHNFLSYDARVLKKILNIRIKGNRITDTLVVSRLQAYSRQGGHSLHNWGEILKHPKLPFKDFSEYTPEMLEYCINDVELNYKVACYLKSEGGKYGSAKAEAIEHAVQYLLDEQKERGFALDVKKAHKLFALFGNRAARLELEILAEMPPVPKFIDVREPKYKADGSLSVVGLKKPLGDGWENCSGPFSYVEWEEFDLNSPKQKVKRLNPYWKPTVRTKGYRKLNDKLRSGEINQDEFDQRQQYMWQVCEENLQTLPPHAPSGLSKLADYAMYVARRNEVEGWLDALGSDNRVHGTTFSIGAVTHRMSHNSPNMANIPGSDSPYGTECRSCFTVADTDNRCLLGVDASGIQLRVLAHYMNDPDYTKEVVDGDIHTKNLEAMGIDKGEWDEEHGQWSARSTAKTFIYAWLLGAGDEKVGLICGGDSSFGRRVKQTFLESLPALADLKEEATKTARTGRLVGIDGRHIEIKSAHYALSCYLQGAESCIMKKAMIDWHLEVRKRNLDAQMVAVVHDEFQIDVRKEHADEVGNIVVDSIIKAGEYFNLNCPMDGEYRIGNNWAETH